MEFGITEHEASCGILGVTSGWVVAATSHERVYSRLLFSNRLRGFTAAVRISCHTGHSRGLQHPLVGPREACLNLRDLNTHVEVEC